MTLCSLSAQVRLLRRNKVSGRVEIRRAPSVRVRAIFGGYSPAPTLIGEAGIGKTVTNTQIPLVQSRPNDFINMFASRRKHQKRLGFGMHGLAVVEQEFAAIFPQAAYRLALA